MTPKQRQLLEKLYPAVLALPERDQAAFLRERCSDQRVRSEIERLLESGGSGSGDELVLRKGSTGSVAEPISSEFAPTTPLPSEEVRRRDSDPAGTESIAPRHFEIPDYELMRCIGQGAFGSVWLSRSATGVFCAVKVIPKDLMTQVEFEGLKNFQTHSLGHSTIIEVRHVGKTPSCFYYVMELADGYETSPTFSPNDYTARSLHDDIARHGPIPVEEAVKICRQIATGLGHLHGHNLLHRDVKPGNVVFVKGQPKLADLGLLTQASRITTKAHTPQYAPPEGIQDRSGDLYCLGKTLIHMVSGMSPDLYPEAAERLPSSTRKAMARIEPAVARACAEDPASRFQTADAFLAELHRVLPLWKRLRLQKTVPAAISVALLALVLGYFFGGAPPPAPSATLYVNHFLPNRDRVGFAGLHSREVYLDDRITVEARLEPALHCFLVALFPDGSTACWYPRDDSSAPLPTDRIQAPLDREGTHVYWSLEEGTGYQAFVLLGSSRPLPAFREWLKEAGEIPWKPCRGRGVWERESGHTRHITVRGTTSEVVRGPPPPFEAACDLWERAPGIEVLHAIAVPVAARR